ncbi:O-antigen ligase family protein [Aureitalea marina]|uniref:O-antigen ligase family protein n=1 Tax=Aureitalea marina TaxID=930804 RepID=UPI000CF23118|nr:O-antigen ligase family protein [Aureitalea marina]
MNLTRNNNPFEQVSGQARLARPILLVGIGIATAVSAVIVAKLELLGVIFCLGVVGLAFYLNLIFKNPRLGVLSVLVMGFLATGLSRYVQLPWGLCVDGLIALTYLALFFKGFETKLKWRNAKSGLTLVTVLWMVYVLFQLINPEAVSLEAWFYAMRGLAMYQWLLIPLAFLLFNKPRDLKIFFWIWGILSVLGTLKGFQQFFLGVDPWEQNWLNQGGAETHVLFSKLRIFSFYSDAGQFGASQGHTAVVFGILALFNRHNHRLRMFFVAVALAGLVGMVISGTRGALAVPAIGGIVFLILRKNLPILILGGLLGVGVYIFFAHTNIGQGNAEIRRMRTAFDPNEASLQVRLDNQKKLSGYLASRPFGGGVGSAGNWGQRFTPHTFLANTATDSWYVMIWAETGAVGLSIYLIIILSILVKGAYHVMAKIKDPWLNTQITALVCGMAGIMAASYGNGVFGQFPTGILMYLGMVFMFLAPKWEKQYRNTLKKQLY